MTTNLICRVCLCSDKILRELDDELADHLEEMCDFNNEESELLSCTVCEKALRNNYNFTNRCRKANRILQGWRNCKRQNKVAVESLYKLLETWTDVKPEPKYFDIKDEDDILKDPVALNANKDIVIIKTIKEDEFKQEIKNENMDIDNKIEEETNRKVKFIFLDDVPSDEDSDDDHPDDVDHPDDIDHPDDVDHLQSVKNEETNDDYCDYEVLDVELLECKNENTEDLNMGSEIHTENSNSNEGKTVKAAPKRTKTFEMYEDVFDIHLFETEQEVRDEVCQRRYSEPYLSAAHRCELCYKVFRYEKLLKFHMKWHDPASGAFECQICYMRYPTRRALTNHNHHSHRGKFTCKKCPMSTYYAGVMMKHFLKHQNGEVFKCHCDPNKEFESMRSYLSHKRSAHAHVCVTCARGFASQGGLLVHRIAMHQTQSLVDLDVTAAVRCEPCKLTFANQQVYTVHLLNTDAHKDIAKDIIGCSICGYTFDEFDQLKEHRRLHRNKKKTNQSKPIDTNECQVCGATGDGLRWLYHHHRRSHPQSRYQPHAKRSHLCDQCGRSFTGASQLLEHSRTHTGVRPFCCDLCGKGFRIKQFLVDHMVWHGPPSKECTECGKKYHSKAGLFNHMRGHIGDRRYKCSECGRGFLTPAMMREHVRGVHLHVRRQRRRPQQDDGTNKS